MANTAGDEANGFGTPLVNGFEGIDDNAALLLLLISGFSMDIWDIYGGNRKNSGGGG